MGNYPDSAEYESQHDDVSAFTPQNNEGRIDVLGHFKNGYIYISKECNNGCYEIGSTSFPDQASCHFEFIALIDSSSKFAASQIVILLQGNNSVPGSSISWHSKNTAKQELLSLLNKYDIRYIPTSTNRYQYAQMNGVSVPIIVNTSNIRSKMDLHRLIEQPLHSQNEATYQTQIEHETKREYQEPGGYETKGGDENAMLQIENQYLYDLLMGEAKSQVFKLAEKHKVYPPKTNWKQIADSSHNYKKIWMAEVTFCGSKIISRALKKKEAERKCFEELLKQLINGDIIMFEK